MLYGRAMGLPPGERGRAVSVLASPGRRTAEGAWLEDRPARRLCLRAAGDRRVRLRRRDQRWRASSSSRSCSPLARPHSSSRTRRSSRPRRPRASGLTWGRAVQHHARDGRNLHGRPRTRRRPAGGSSRITDTTPYKLDPSGAGMFSTGGLSNFSGYANAEEDRLIERDRVRLERVSVLRVRELHGQAAPAPLAAEQIGLGGIPQEPGRDHPMEPVLCHSQS